MEQSPSALHMDVRIKFQDAFAKPLVPPFPIFSIDGDDLNSYTCAIIQQDNDDLIIKGDGEILATLPNCKFRSVLFCDCFKIKFVINTKLLGIEFIDCSKCTVSINTDLIGPFSLLRCTDFSVNVKNKVNIFQVNLCDDIRFFQRIPESIYVVTTSTNVKGIIIDGFTCKIRQQTTIGPSLFNDQIYVLFSADRGAIYINKRYCGATDIEQHMVRMDPDPHNDDLGAMSP